MDFKMEKSPSLTGYTNRNGERMYYPTYRILIVGDNIAAMAELEGCNLTPDDVARIIECSNDEITDAITRIIMKNVFGNDEEE